MRERARDGAEVANDRIGDLRRGVAERTVLALEQIRPLAGPVPDKRTDPQLPVLLGERVEPGDPVDVHERPRRGEAELHHGNEAHAAGEHLGFVADPFECRQCLVERRGLVVFEAPHALNTAASVCGICGSSAPVSWRVSLNGDSCAR